MGTFTPDPDTRIVALTRHRLTRHPANAVPTTDPGGMVTSEPRSRADQPRSYAAVWSDEDAGPLLRGYMVTGGRTRAPGDDLDPTASVRATGTPASVRATGPADPRAGLYREHHALLDACRHPTPVSELPGATGLAPGVLRVLLGDLLERQLVVVHGPQTPLPDEDVLEAVVRRLRGL